MSMRLDEFFEALKTRAATSPHERPGQALFNLLLEVRPDIAEVMRATPSDPFWEHGTKSPRYHSAVRVIEAHWEKVL